MTVTDASEYNDIQKSLWDIGFFRLSLSKQAAVPHLRATLRKCANPLGPFLADVSRKSSQEKFGKSDVAAVESHLIDEYGKQGALVPLRILKGAIFNLNRHYQKGIPRLARLERLTKDPNLLPKNLSEVQRRVATWVQAEKRWLEQCSESTGDEGVSDSTDTGPFAWQMVIASAALHGGLVNVDRAVALARAMADPQQHFGCSTIRGYADLVLMTSRGRNEEIIRWYPDGRLLLLISRVSPDEVKKAIAHSSQLERFRIKCIHIRTKRCSFRIRIA
jgi:hypothetical protein